MQAPCTPHARPMHAAWCLQARTLWGGLINTCRNIVRQSNSFFPDDAKHAVLKRRMAAESSAYVKVSQYLGTQHVVSTQLLSSQ